MPGVGKYVEMNDGSEDEDDLEDEDEEQEDEAVQIPIPPSPEVRDRSRGILWVFVGLLVAGYPMVKSAAPKVEAWIAAKTAPEAELDCRPVDGITVNRGGRIEPIPRACLPKEVWVYYRKQGLDARETAVSAGTAFIEGERPWKEAE